MVSQFCNIFLPIPDLVEPLVLWRSWKPLSWAQECGSSLRWAEFLTKNAGMEYLSIILELYVPHFCSEMGTMKSNHSVREGLAFQESRRRTPLSMSRGNSSGLHFVGTSFCSCEQLRQLHKTDTKFVLSGMGTSQCAWSPTRSSLTVGSGELKA